MIRFPWLGDWLAFTALALLAFSTVVHHAAGLFWLALLLLGVVYGLQRDKAKPSAESDTRSTLLRSIAKTWLFCCAVALFLKTIPMLYWSGPWQERHAEFKLLLGAWTCYLLVLYPKWPHHWGVRLGHALALSCVLSYALCVFWGSNAAPTNRIPWAAGVSILACVLLVWSFLNPRYAQVWRVCSLMAVMAVLISGVRGSYPLLLIWPLAWWWTGRRYSFALGAGQLKFLALTLVVLLGVAALLPGVESPVHRVQQAVTELGLSTPNGTGEMNSSTGARLVLWKAGLQAFQENWFMGHGFTGAKEVIKAAAHQSDSQTVSQLGHFHNDYIHTAVEFGLLGLLSFLTYGVGMAWCAWLLYKASHKTAATGLVAVLLMHMSASMSNMNFAHNFYPTILSFGVTLLLLTPLLMKPR
jgi:O-antigen ligase